jgi:hypothetical protein
MLRSSRQDSDGVAGALVMHLCVYCAAGACFALALYFLMQPTRLPNPGMAAHKSSPVTLNYVEVLRAERDAAKRNFRVVSEPETTGAASRQLPEVKPEVKLEVKPEVKKARAQSTAQSSSGGSSRRVHRNPPSPCTTRNSHSSGIAQCTDLRACARASQRERGRARIAAAQRGRVGVQHSNGPAGRAGLGIGQRRYRMMLALCSSRAERHNSCSVVFACELNDDSTSHKSMSHKSIASSV